MFGIDLRQAQGEENGPLIDAIDEQRSVVRLSVTPSTKWSCLGSPPIFTNGSTTTRYFCQMRKVVIALLSTPSR
jgi:hypothetical protein